MGPALAGAPGASPGPGGAAQQIGEPYGRTEAAGPPRAHLDLPAGGAVSAAPSTPASPAALANGAEHTTLAEGKQSLASEGSELGKEGSTIGSVTDSTDSTGASSGSLAPHYDANQDVILRLEFLRTTEIKVWGVPSAGSARPSVCRCAVASVCDDCGLHNLPRRSSGKTTPSPVNSRTAAHTCLAPAARTVCRPSSVPCVQRWWRGWPCSSSCSCSKLSRYWQNARP